MSITRLINWDKLKMELKLMTLKDSIIGNWMIDWSWDWRWISWKDSQNFPIFNNPLASGLNFKSVIIFYKSNVLDSNTKQFNFTDILMDFFRDFVTDLMKEFISVLINASILSSLDFKIWVLFVGLWNHFLSLTRPSSETTWLKSENIEQPSLNPWLLACILGRGS